MAAPPAGGSGRGPWLRFAGFGRQRNSRGPIQHRDSYNAIDTVPPTGEIVMKVLATITVAVLAVTAFAQMAPDEARQLMEQEGQLSPKEARQLRSEKARLHRENVQLEQQLADAKTELVKLQKLVEGPAQLAIPTSKQAVQRVTQRGLPVGLKKGGPITSMPVGEVGTYQIATGADGAFLMIDTRTGTLYRPIVRDALGQIWSANPPIVIFEK